MSRRDLLLLNPNVLAAQFPMPKGVRFRAMLPKLKRAFASNPDWLNPREARAIAAEHERKYQRRERYADDRHEFHQLLKQSDRFDTHAVK